MIDAVILKALEVVGALVVIGGAAWSVFELFWGVYKSIHGLREIQKAMLFSRDYRWLKDVKPVVNAARSVVKQYQAENLSETYRRVAFSRLVAAVNEMDKENS